MRVPGRTTRLTFRGHYSVSSTGNHMLARVAAPCAAKRRTHAHAARDRKPTEVRWVRRSGHAWVGVHAGCAAYSQPHTLPPHTVPSRPSMATTSPSPSMRASCWPKSSLMCPVSFDCGMTPTPWCRACKIRRGQLSVDGGRVACVRVSSPPLTPPPPPPLPPPPPPRSPACAGANTQRGSACAVKPTRRNQPPAPAHKN